MIFALDDPHVYSSPSFMTEQSATTAITEFDVEMDPDFVGDVSMSSVSLHRLPCIFSTRTYASPSLTPSLAT